MFYVEEDVQPAVAAAEKIFGKPGTYRYGKNVIPNMAIAVKEYGKIWYGDIRNEDLTDGCRRLAGALQKTVHLMYTNSNFQWDTAIVYDHGFSKNS